MDPSCRVSKFISWHDQFIYASYIRERGGTKNDFFFGSESFLDLEIFGIWLANFFFRWGGMLYTPYIVVYNNK